MTALIQFDKDKHIYRDAEGNIYTSATQHVAKLFPFDEQELAEYISPDNPDELLDKWKKARQDGHKFHRAIEKFLKKQIPFPDTIELKQWKNWYENMDVEIIASEVMVWDRHTFTAGTIDCIYRDHDGLLYIVDWKRTSVDLNSSCPMSAPAPFNKFPATKLTQYTIQLSIYAILWERMGNEQIAGGKIVVCHPKLDEAKMWKVKLLRKEVEQYLATKPT